MCHSNVYRIVHLTSIKELGQRTPTLPLVLLPPPQPPSSFAPGLTYSIPRPFYFSMICSSPGNCRSFAGEKKTPRRWMEGRQTPSNIVFWLTCQNVSLVSSLSAQPHQNLCPSCNSTLLLPASEWYSLPRAPTAS